MDFLSDELNSYIEAHTKPESAVLGELNRRTYADVIMPRMIAGHLQGQVLTMLSRMINPKNIIDIGTFTGYSAICLAQGLQEGGMLYTIDINEELEDIVREHIGKAGMTNRIDYRIGNATDIIPSIDKTFDIVYIDADKENYSNYYDMTFDKVPSGGYIIADNVLWSGNVIEPASNWDQETKAIDAYNKKIHDDPRVDNVLFPIRDGLMLARKL